MLAGLQYSMSSGHNMIITGILAGHAVTTEPRGGCGVVTIGITERIDTSRWIQREWGTVGWKPVANKDLWQAFLKRLRELAEGWPTAGIGSGDKPAGQLL